MHPELTGNGRLVESDEAESGLDNLTQKSNGADIEKMLVSGILAIALIY